MGGYCVNTNQMDPSMKMGISLKTTVRVVLTTTCFAVIYHISGLVRSQARGACSVAYSRAVKPAYERTGTGKSCTVYSAAVRVRPAAVGWVVNRYLKERPSLTKL